MGLLFVRHFERLLGSPHPVLPASHDICVSGPLVPSTSFPALLAEITTEEVWQTLSSFGNEKAPGPDGFNAKFYKHAWPRIGSDVVLVIQEFFRSGRLLKRLNHAFIALVPKKENASTVGDFRPISCCNLIYKIISKILATRIEPILSSIVGDYQAAFLGGRSMNENVFLVQELFRKYMRKRVSPRCIFKVDLQKAFDSVNWDFLRWLLSHIGFPPRFVGWIMECITTTSYSVIDRINALCRNFLWGKNADSHIKPKVSWQSVCLPKPNGGLGLHNLKIWNRSLLCPVLWNIHLERISLWVRWVHHVYLRGASVWTVIPSKTDSPLFKQLLLIRDTIVLKAGSISSAISLLESWQHGSRIKATSVYLFLLGSLPRVRWQPVIWQPDVFPRWAFILWLATLDKLLTLDRAPFLNRGTLCPLCHSHPETRNHLFFACPFSIQVWITIRQWQTFPRRFLSLQRTVNWLSQSRRHSGQVGRVRCIVVAATTYFIWEARNSALFDSAHITCDAVTDKIKFHIMRAIHLAKLY